MPKPSTARLEEEAMAILSQLMLSPNPEAEFSSKPEKLQNISQQEFGALLALAHANHVAVRAIEVFRGVMISWKDDMRAEWAETAIAAEHARIANALGFLSMIFEAFDEAGLDVTVIKSLDHWPDFGSDIDLYSNSSSDEVCSLMQKRFGARLAAQSWGDRLACKRNFEIPGLPEAVEVHIGRLGQTGEQLALASRLPGRSRAVQFDGHTFRVASPSDRILISTLQRMYRHFYFRLCDIVDSAGLIESGALDFSDLQDSAQRAGIWEGVATYIVLVSDYVRRYRGTGLVLPQFAKEAARFGGEVMYVGGSFLRIPILPQSIGLYRSQFAGTLRRGDVHSSARLGLLPWLATAAAIGQKITGSDKGIW